MTTHAVHCHTSMIKMAEVSEKRLKVEDAQDNHPVEEAVTTLKEDFTGQKYKLTHVVKENVSNVILDVQVIKLKGGDTPNTFRDLFLTFQSNQANVYEGRHLDLASHFKNAPSDHVVEVSDISCCCWLTLKEEENDVLVALGSMDGIVQIISLAESRVKRRLGDAALKLKVIDICASRREPHVFASMLEDERGQTIIEVWDCVSNLKRTAFVVATKGEFRRVQYLPTKDTIVVTTEDELYFFDKGSESARFSLPAKATDVRLLNKSTALLLLTNGTSLLFDLESRGKRAVFPKDVLLTCIAVSQCGRYLAAGDDTGGSYILDNETGEVTTMRSSKTKCFTTSCCFSSDAPNRLICTSSDGGLWCWQLNQPI